MPKHESTPSPPQIQTTPTPATTVTPLISNPITSTISQHQVPMSNVYTKSEPMYENVSSNHQQQQSQLHSDYQIHQHQSQPLTQPQQQNSGLSFEMSQLNLNINNNNNNNQTDQYLQHTGLIHTQNTMPPIPEQQQHQQQQPSQTPMQIEPVKIEHQQHYYQPQQQQTTQSLPNTDVRMIHLKKLFYLY